MKTDQIKDRLSKASNPDATEKRLCEIMHNYGEAMGQHVIQKEFINPKIDDIKDLLEEVERLEKENKWLREL